MNTIPQQASIAIIDVAGPPFAFTIWLVLLALLVLAGFVAVVTLVILAIVKNRPGLAALAGGLVLVGLVGMLLMAGLAYFSVAPHATEVYTDWHHGPAGLRVPVAGEARFDGPHVTTVNWGVSLPMRLLVIVGIAALAVYMVRRLTSKQTMGEHRLGWLQALAIVVAAMVMLALVGSRSVDRVATPELAKRFESGTAFHPIEELEQRFTAPKIPLPPEPSQAPSPQEALTVAAASEAVIHAADVASALSTSEGDESEEPNEVAPRSDALAEEQVPSESPAQAVGLPPADAAKAAQELIAGLAAFGRAMHQVFDEYARHSAADVETKGANLPVERTFESPAKSRPDWVDDPPKRVGNVWREVVVAGDYATDEEAYRAADVYLLLATYEHLVRLTDINFRPADRWRPALTFGDAAVWADARGAYGTHRYVILQSDGSSRDYRLSALRQIGVGIDYVRREIATDEFLETVDRSVGPMKRLYTLVEFTPAVDRELRERWEAHRQQERLARVGMGAGSVLGLLVVLWGLLQIDTLTKGYYTKRLFIGVPAAIIGLVALLALWNVS